MAPERVSCETLCITAGRQLTVCGQRCQYVPRGRSAWIATALLSGLRIWLIAFYRSNSVLGASQQAGMQVETPLRQVGTRYHRRSGHGERYLLPIHSGLTRYSGRSQSWSPKDEGLLFIFDFLELCLLAQMAQRLIFRGHTLDCTFRIPLPIVVGRTARSHSLNANAKGSHSFIRKLFLHVELVYRKSSVLPR